VPRARDRAHDRQVVLVIDHYVPHPDRDAGSRTMVAFMRALLDAGWVVKFWPFNLYRAPHYTEALQDMGVEVLYGPHQTMLTEWLKANGPELDLVLLSRPDVAEICLPVVRAGTTARIAYYGHDLHFRRMLDEARLSGDPRQRRAADSTREMEIAAWRGSDLVLHPSEEEAAEVRAMVPSVAARAVIPYAFGAPAEMAADLDGDLDTGGPWILFVAGFGHPPNAEAAVWFTREVLPSILAEVPGARLAIVGSNPPPRIGALCGPHVSLFANVTDGALNSWYRRARVAVVPLLAGAGVKLKTVEALWHGVPVVLTPAGAQGLPGIESVAPVTSDPAAFASAVRALLTDSILWRRHSEQGIAYASERFSATAQRQSLLRALDVIMPSTRRARPLEAPAKDRVKGCAAKVAMA
jgi:glycosyltransferase involved in cell wall biosynthesis